jgi:hypothetical protein
MVLERDPFELRQAVLPEAIRREEERRMTKDQDLYLSFLRRGIWLRRRGDRITWGDAKPTVLDVSIIRGRKQQLLEICDSLDPKNWTTLSDPRGGVFSVTTLKADFVLAVAEAA